MSTYCNVDLPAGIDTSNTPIFWASCSGVDPCSPCALPGDSGRTQPAYWPSCHSARKPPPRSLLKYTRSNTSSRQARLSFLATKRNGDVYWISSNAFSSICVSPSVNIKAISAKNLGFVFLQLSRLKLFQPKIFDVLDVI